MNKQLRKAYYDALIPELEKLGYTFIEYGPPEDVYHIFTHPKGYIQAHEAQITLYTGELYEFDLADPTNTWEHIAQQMNPILEKSDLDLSANQEYEKVQFAIG